MNQSQVTTGVRSILDLLVGDYQILAFKSLTNAS